MASSGRKPRVCYFYDEDVGLYHYAPGHPMKPFRMRMTHDLIVNYGLEKHMQIFRPDRATPKEMTKFHSDDYIEYLKRITPDEVDKFEHLKNRFNIWDDNPVFDGLYEFCSISAGGSVCAAKRLNDGAADIAINWAGGLHHAKKDGASGFCYVNDIVLGILELLKFHQRVLYIDIDAHHGDGVEEAFYSTDRVMTVSFHKYGDFFPGTGDLSDIGVGRGRYYSVNVPLRDGIDDETYHSIFEPIMQYIMDWYRPGAVFLQAGTDSLAGDRLGCFNLSHVGHGRCLEFMKKFNVPILLTGGGGYTPKNVSRTWCYETSLACDIELDPLLPYNNYFEYFGPNYRLEVLRGSRPHAMRAFLTRRHFAATNMPNMNTPEYLRKVRETVLAHLKELEHAPSVQLQQVPVDHFSDEDVEDEDKFKDERVPQRDRDARVSRPNEYEDSDDEGAAKGPKKGNKVYQTYRDPAAAASAARPPLMARGMLGTRPAQSTAAASAAAAAKRKPAEAPAAAQAPRAAERMDTPDGSAGYADSQELAGDGDVEMA
ncbi:histone deacetylase, partial [Hyaloraphidium curvatum]